ncbi:MAG TPA: helix-turn-helix transcriptional regulator [Thermoguttaceae bacterium]|nr:helix-turn-helix transcriptional regulator [Thermoguttaceae bacterium]
MSRNRTRSFGWDADPTRHRISKRTGIPQPVLSRFVNHRTGLSIETVDKLGKCLGLRLVAEGEPARKRTKKKDR